MKNINKWTTSELIEFLNSYNRVFNERPNEALKYQPLYISAFAELYDRSELLAMLY